MFEYKKELSVCYVGETLDIKVGSGRFSYSFIRAIDKKYKNKRIILINRGEKEVLPGSKAVLFVGKYTQYLFNPFVIAWYSRKFNLIHVFDGAPYSVMVFFNFLITRKPYLVTYYGTYAVAPLCRRYFKYIMRAAYRCATFNFPISNLTARKIREYYKKVELKVILQGIDFNYYQKPRKFNFDINEDYLLAVGAIKARKGYHVAIPVFAEVKKRFNNLKFVIVGQKIGNGYKKILKMIKDYELEESIIWLENLPENDLISLYQNAKIYFMPSLAVGYGVEFEGFGSVFVEAQACGVPIVSSLGGGMEDSVNNGQSGFLVPEGDVAGYAKMIVKLLNNKELYNKFSKAARIYAKSLDWTNTIQEYYKYYNKGIKNER